MLFLLLILALSGCLRFLLALYAGLLVIFSFTKLSEESGLHARALKSAKRALESLVFLDPYFCHSIFPPFAIGKEIKYLKISYTVYTIFSFLSIVFTFFDI